MPARKMRVDVYDEDGNRYSITFEGRVTRDKALKILDTVELLGGMPNVESSWEYRNEVSKINRVHSLIEQHLPGAWFSAKEVRETYEKEVKEPISLSTVSTYLSRLADRGLLSKNRTSNRVQYRLISESLQKMFPAAT